MSTYNASQFRLKRFFLQINIALLGVVLAGLVALSIAYTGLRNVNDNADHLRKLAAAMANVAFDSVQIQQFLTDVAATHEAGGYDEAKVFHALAQQEIATLRQLDPTRSADWSALQVEVDSLYQTGQTMAKAYVDSGLEAGNQFMKTPGTGFDDKAKALTDHVNKLKEAIDKSHDQAEDDLDATVDRVGWMGAVVIALFLVSMPAISIYTYTRIHQQIGGEPHAAVSFAEHLAQGELDQQIDVGAELSSSLMGRLNQMKHRWTDVVSGLRGQASLLSSTSDATAFSARELEKNSAEQNSSVAMIGENMTELSVRTDLVAASAAEANQKVSEAGQRAQNGAELVMALARDMEAIAGMINVSAQQTEQLDERANEIQSIVSVIREIAAQTNLLALNAAIEAARAGEQGRGFAVVADEVRKLAERTTQSTSTIAATITMVRETTGQIVGTIRSSVDRVASGMTLMDRTSHEMTDVVELSNEASARVGMIDVALREQRTNIIDITQRTQGIVAHAAANSSAAAELAQQSASLKQISDALHGDISFFKTAAGNDDAMLF